MLPGVEPYGCGNKELARPTSMAEEGARFLNPHVICRAQSRRSSVLESEPATLQNAQTPAVTDADA
jgi:hypothetical protein